MTKPAFPPKHQHGAVERILDANGNRVSEGLRVVEDYLRYGWNDQHRAAVCKRLRHQLATLLAQHLAPSRLAYRDAGADVGQTITLASEQERRSVPAVLSANFQRVQQGLRSLEEWAKLLAPQLAADLEQMRYAAYRLESEVARQCHSAGPIGAARLYVLIDGGASELDFQQRCAQLVAGEVPVLQLRDKRLTDRELLARAVWLRRQTEATSTRVIINDRADIAALVGADGVHLGQEDLPVAAARTLLGPIGWVGRSTHEAAQIESALAEGADYLGVGPTFPTPTKSFPTFPGLPFLRQASAYTQAICFAIGGITLQNLDDVLATGITRVAVSSAIWRAADCGAACASFLSQLGAPTHERTTPQR